MLEALLWLWLMLEALLWRLLILCTSGVSSLGGRTALAVSTKSAINYHQSCQKSVHQIRHTIKKKT